MGSYDPTKCEASVSAGGTWSRHSSQCTRPWKTEREHREIGFGDSEPKIEQRRVCGVHARAKYQHSYVDRPRPLVIGAIEYRLTMRHKVADTDALANLARKGRETLARALGVDIGRIEAVTNYGAEVVNADEVEAAASGKAVSPMPEPSS